MNDQELRFILRLRDDANVVIRRNQSAFRQLGTDAEAASRHLERSATQLRDIATAYLGLRTGLVVARASTQAFMQIEDILIGVAKTTNMTASEMEAFGGAFRDLAARMSTPISELGEVAIVAGQLGVTGVDNIIAFTEEVGKLGAVADISGQDAATAIARLLKITGEGPGVVKNFVAALVQLGNDTAANEGQIMHLASEIARATAGMGLAGHEILAIAASLGELDQRAELSGNAMQRILKTLNDLALEGGPVLAELAGKVGMSAEEMSRAIQENPVQALKLFVQALINTQKETGSYTRLLKDLHLNQDETRKIMAPLTVAFAGFNKNLATGAKAWADGTAAQTEYNRASEALSKALVNAQNRVTLLAETLGGALAPELEAIVRALGAFADDLRHRFADLDETTQKWIAGVVLGGPALLGVAAAGRGLATVLDVVTGRANVAKSAILGLFTLIRSHPMGALVTVAGSAAAAMYLFSDSLDDNREAARSNQDRLIDYGRALDETRAKINQLGLSEAELLQWRLTQARASNQTLGTGLDAALRSPSFDMGGFLDEQDEENAFGKVNQKIHARARRLAEAAENYRKNGDPRLLYNELIAVHAGLPKDGSADLLAREIQTVIGQAFDLQKVRDDEATNAKIEQLVKDRIVALKAAVANGLAQGAAGSGGGSGSGVRTPLAPVEDSLQRELDQFLDKGADAPLDDLSRQIQQIQRERDELIKGLKGTEGEAENVARITQAAQAQINAVYQDSYDKQAERAKAIASEIDTFKDKANLSILDGMAEDLLRVDQEAEDLIAKIQGLPGAAAKTKEIQAAAAQARDGIILQAQVRRQLAVSEAERETRALNDEVTALALGAKAYAAYKIEREVASNVERFEEALEAAGLEADEVERLALTYRDAAMAAAEGEESFEKFKKKQEEIRDRVEDVRDAFSDMATDIIFEAKSIDEAISSLAQELAKTLFTRTLMDPLAESLSNGITNSMGGGGWGDIVGTIFGLAAEHGHAFAEGRVQAFAKGGMVGRPTLFAHAGGVGLMGEAGTEAILPLTRMGNGDLGVQAAGASGGVVVHAPVNITIEGGATGDPKNDEALAKKVGSAVHSQLKSIVTAQLREQMRPGNMLNPVGSI